MNDYASSSSSSATSLLTPLSKRPYSSSSSLQLTLSSSIRTAEIHSTFSKLSSPSLLKSYRSSPSSAVISDPIYMMNIQNNTWRAEIWNFSWSVQLDISRENKADERDKVLNKRREIQYQYLRGNHVLF